MSRLLAIAAGGTGGHMFPAQALAETMLARGWRVALLSDARGLRYAAGFPEAVVRREIRAASPGRGGLTGLLGLPVTLARGIAGAIAAMRGDRPALLAGFGGYPSFPPLVAATALRVPILIHEQNAVLGAVNRRFARRARAVACGTWPVANAPAGARLEPTGNPVRARVLAAVTPYTPPGEGRLRLLVFGGSQGASVFARTLPGALAALPEALRTRIALTQQIRSGDAQTLAPAYERAGIEAHLAEFFDDLPERIAAAHLVVARAGASTVAEIAAIGRPSILVPLPSAAGDHQSANARALAERGAAGMIAEAALTPQTLADEIARLLGAPDVARDMAEAARAAAIPDAAARLADLAEEIAA